MKVIYVSGLLEEMVSTFLKDGRVPTPNEIMEQTLAQHFHHIGSIQ